MSSIKEWFRSRKRNQEALERMKQKRLEEEYKERIRFSDPFFFCEFSDICIIKKPSNCTICLRHKIIKGLLKDMSNNC